MGAASVGLPIGMAQFVLLGDAAESALLRGEENVGMGEAEMLDFWGASVDVQKRKTQTLVHACMSRKARYQGK
jgi:hypothetical protein